MECIFLLTFLPCHPFYFVFIVYVLCWSPQGKSRPLNTTLQSLYRDIILFELRLTKKIFNHLILKRIHTLETQQSLQSRDCF